MRVSSRMFFHTLKFFAWWVIWATSVGLQVDNHTKSSCSILCSHWPDFAGEMLDHRTKVDELDAMRRKFRTLGLGIACRIERNLEPNLLIKTTLLEGLR